MGILGGLLALPVSGPLGALQWLAKQVADNAIEKMLDPARIEVALRALEKRLDAGELTEEEFEAEEALLLEELAEMRATKAEMDAQRNGTAEEDDEAEDVEEVAAPEPVVQEAEPWSEL